MSPDMVSVGITHEEDLFQKLRRGAHENFHKVKEVCSAIPGIWLNGDLHADEISSVSMKAENYT